MKILVIGESCRDVFHYGKCDRLAPEAPAPVFNPLKTVENGGMAKNVYKNLLALGIDANLFTNENWNTITKTRYIDFNMNHMFLRVDTNDKKYGRAQLKRLRYKNYDAIIISDYDDMKSMVLNMVKAGYMFNMDRDRLRDAMEDITFMLCPDDDANKDRVERGLEYDDDDSEDDIEDIGDTADLLC